MATGIAVRCRRDARCRHCTGKRLSRAIWPSFNKEGMSHLCDSTVASPTARRNNVLASKYEYPPFRYPPFKCALRFRRQNCRRKNYGHEVFSESRRLQTAMRSICQTLLNLPCLQETSPRDGGAEILVSVRIFARNSRAGNGCANFMDAWKLRSFCRKTQCP